MNDNVQTKAHFGDDKTETTILLQKKILSKLEGNYSLKQHNTVKYSGWYLDSNLNRESMAHQVPKKIIKKLNS